MSRRSWVWAAGSLWVIAAAWSALVAASPQNTPVASVVTGSPQQHQAVLDQYCVTCHNDRLKTGGFSLQSAKLTDVLANADVWEKVNRKLRTRMMPPAGARRPDEAAYEGLSTFLESTLDRAAASQPYPGRPLLHRMNRTEYQNAIRDLLDLDVDATVLLPADDTAYGFDNNADSLGVSPVLMERYLSAASKISTLAIGDMRMAPGSETFRTPQDLSQHEHREGLPLGTVGGMNARVFVPLDGEYEIRAKLIRTNLNVTRGLENEREVEFSVDGARVHLAKFGGVNDNKASYDNPTLAGEDIDSRLVVKVPLKAGPRNVGVAFIKRSDSTTADRLQPFIRSSQDPTHILGMPQLEFVSVTGPFNPTGVGDTPSRRRVFVCRPATAAEELPCATRILSTLARRAYRRTPTKAEIGRLVAFYQQGRQGKTFDAGIQMGLNRLLASPNFVFRAEPSPAGVAAGATYRVSDAELASRLSFFLWSTIPDDQLLDLAARGRLSNPAVLAQQVKRMLADPKAQQFVKNFAGQWLWLRNLDNIVPNSRDFPDYDDNLRQSLRRETEMLFDSIIREDRGVLDLLTADYTFANERLAKHYGIKGVYGEWMRRVTVPQDERRGLLGQGSLLVVTSHADRTSPVVRGKWILENLVGANVPPPPPDVPAFKEKEAGDAPRTMRERMAQHRANPACASCHGTLDPVGFAMDNFDAVGAWRTHEEDETGPPIDSTGAFMGQPVNGVVQLRRVLAGQFREQFVRALTEKLMIYAVGRGLDHRDMPTIRRIVREARAADFKFSSLLAGIVTSPPFQMATAPEE